MAQSRFLRTISLVGAIAAGVLALMLLAQATPSAHAKDQKDCSDFNTQKQAQRWFRHHHPRRDPSHLDNDNDRIACESNRCPCSRKWHRQHGKFEAREARQSTLGGEKGSAGALTIKPGRYSLTKLGHFHPRRNPTLKRAIRVFGKPSSRHSRLNGNECKVAWKDKRLHIKFANYGSGNACSRRGGRAQSVVIKRSRKWRTSKHLRVGQSVDHLLRLYPQARQHGRAFWWLKTAYSAVGSGGNYAVLAARVHHGRVNGFRGWIGAAGE